MPFEIYWNETRTTLMSEDIVMGTTKRLDEWAQNDIQAFDSSIATLRPKSYKALCEEYGYGPQFAFNRV